MDKSSAFESALDKQQQVEAWSHMKSLFPSMKLKAEACYFSEYRKKPTCLYVFASRLQLLCKYTIPAGTSVLIHFWKLRDSNHARPNNQQPVILCICGWTGPLKAATMELNRIVSDVRKPPLQWRLWLQINRSGKSLNQGWVDRVDLDC